MTDDLDATPLDRSPVKRVVARLDGFARGLGLDRAIARQIVEALVTDLPGRDDEALAMEARKRMLKTAV